MTTLRKHIAPTLGISALDSAGILVADKAEVWVTSESPDHPVDHLFDGRGGPGGTCWRASVPGDQTIILAFLEPTSIRKVILEIEELSVSRTQEMAVAFSRNGGRSYTEVVRQEYTFSPPGTTLEREHWVIHVSQVTHLRLWIRPDKGGKPAFATMTALRLE